MPTPRPNSLLRRSQPNRRLVLLWRKRLCLHLLLWKKKNPAGVVVPIEAKNNQIESGPRTPRDSIVRRGCTC